MDIEEEASKPKAVVEPVEPVAVPNAVEEEEEEYKETITIRASNLVTLQDTLEDIQFQISNMQRDARQVHIKANERYEAQQATLRAILERLPPATKAPPPPPQ
jgi:hypothetical protein